MLNFHFLEKGLGVVSPPHFLCDFSRMIMHILYSINRPNFFVWLSLPFEILYNKYIATVHFPGCDVINFETNLIFHLTLSFFDDVARNVVKNFINFFLFINLGMKIIPFLHLQNFFPKSKTFFIYLELQVIVVRRTWTGLKTRYSLRDYTNVLMFFVFKLRKLFWSCV